MDLGGFIDGTRSYWSRGRFSRPQGPSGAVSSGMELLTTPSAPRTAVGRQVVQGTEPTGCKFKPFVSHPVTACVTGERRVQLAVPSITMPGAKRPEHSLPPAAALVPALGREGAVSLLALGRRLWS